MPKRDADGRHGFDSRQLTRNRTDAAAGQHNGCKEIKQHVIFNSKKAGKNAPSPPTPIKSMQSDSRRERSVLLHGDDLTSVVIAADGANSVRSHEVAAVFASYNSGKCNLGFVLTSLVTSCL